jgi:aquaporin Z
MIAKFLAEILGTFVFLSVIIISANPKTLCEDSWTWLKIGLGLSVSILLVGAISGAHLNPAVSFMLYLNNDINIETLLAYIVAQLIGGALAFFYYGVIKSYKK